MKCTRILLLLFVVLIVLFLILFRKNIISKQPFQNQPQKSPSSQNISPGKIPDIGLTLPAGYTIHIFASDLGAPRVLKFSPGGTLIVSDINGNRVIALPDINNRGVVDLQKVVISSGNHIHGLAFYGGKLFVAEVNRVVRYNWDEKNLVATFDKVLFTLPENNDHNNRTITFDQSGNMYVSVGSTCNVCNEQSLQSATVIISDSESTNPRIFASGLRNAAFTAINPKTGELWGTEMGRDYLGDNLPPDEINIIKDGKDYGWPNCYGAKVPDTNFNPNASNNTCANTEPPIFEIPAHSAPLGLVFINSPQFPQDRQGDLLVSYHGSWNRTIPTGYKVVHMKVEGNTITQVDDFLTGFLQNGQSLGRPVDLTFDSRGNLYISDDKTGNIYIVQKTT